MSLPERGPGRIKFSLAFSDLTGRRPFPATGVAGRRITFAVVIIIIAGASTLNRKSVKDKAGEPCLSDMQLLDGPADGFLWRLTRSNDKAGGVLLKPL